MPPNTERKMHCDFEHYPSIVNREAEKYMDQYSEGGNTRADDKVTKKATEESPKKTTKKNTDKKAQRSKRTYN